MPSMPLDTPFHDEMLLYLYRQQNDWAFEALFERYHALIRSFVLASYYVKRMAQFDIDECIQECEICFYQCTQYYCETLNTRFSTFVKNRLHYCVLNYVEQAVGLNRFVPLDGKEEIIADERAEKRSDKRLVLYELSRAVSLELKGLEKEILRRLIEGQGKQEIVSQLEISSKQYENALYRLRKKIGFLRQ